MLGTVMEQNAVVLDQDVDADVFGFATDELEASVHAFFVRSGTIRGERNWSVERADEVDDGELMADLIVQVYSELTHEAASTPRADAPEDGGAAQGASQSLIINEQRNAIADSQQITATDATARAQATRARTRRMEQTGRADLLEPVAPVPRQILLPFAPARADELEQWLSGLRGERSQSPCRCAATRSSCSTAPTRTRSRRCNAAR